MKAHKSKGGIERIEVDATCISSIFIVRRRQWQCWIKHEQNNGRDNSLWKSSSMLKLLFQVYVIDKALHQENEIVVELGNEPINIIWIISIFEVI
jgi:hypothetical protein